MRPITKWPRPPKDTRTLKELESRLDEIEDEIEELRSERSEIEHWIEELEIGVDSQSLADRARKLLDDSHTEFLCWPEISALEELLVSPTVALISRVRQILGNHNRLFSPIHPS
jgi:uncharacterized protein YhaN